MVRSIALALLFIFLAIPSALTEESVHLLDWSNPDGIARLERSQAKTDFFLLANHFEAQKNKTYCGLASSTIILNALRLDNPAIPKPQDQSLLPESKRNYLPKGFDPIFRRYTQNTLYNDATKSELEVLGKPIEIDGEEITDYGLQLRQLATLLTSHGLDITIRVVNDELGEDTIRQELKHNMETPNDYVLVNYAREVINQQGSGHISPLGAYDEASDSFLILDVNPNTSSWVWVNTPDLIKAMRSFDTVENRGYVLVREGVNKHR